MISKITHIFSSLPCTLTSLFSYKNVEKLILFLMCQALGQVLPCPPAHRHKFHLMKLSSKLFIFWLVLLTCSLHPSLQSTCLTSWRPCRWAQCVAADFIFWFQLYFTSSRIGCVFGYLSVFISTCHYIGCPAECTHDTAVVAGSSIRAMGRDQKV